MVGLGIGKLEGARLHRYVLRHLPISEAPSLDAGCFVARGRTAVAHDLAVGLPPKALGFFGFHYAASDVAQAFALPRYVALGLYMPVGYDPRLLSAISSSFGLEARAHGVKVVAGHTGCYGGLSSPVVSTTAIGEKYGRPKVVRNEDVVMLAGHYGEEAVWLSQGCRDLSLRRLRRMTPLNLSLRLGRTKGVRLLHDLAEGGLAMALLEVARHVGRQLQAESKELEVPGRAKDILFRGAVPDWWMPSFGAVLAIVDPHFEDEVRLACREMGVPCARLAAVGRPGRGFSIDGAKLTKVRRSGLDFLYGRF
jgi:hydrogenase maturation factor